MKVGLFLGWLSFLSEKKLLISDVIACNYLPTFLILTKSYMQNTSEDLATL